MPTNSQTQKMILEFITIEGFGSYVTRQKFWLNNKGITAIIGKVGAGKTTMFSALYWCIYGKPLKGGKEIESYEWLRPKDYQGTKVALHIIKGEDIYIITRCLNFKGKLLGRVGGDRLIVTKNGSPLDELRNKDDVKKFVIKLIGMGPELFKSSLLFGQKLERFISQDGPTKKKILEEAFESSFIQDAKDFTEKHLKRLNEVYAAIQTDILVYEAKQQGFEKNKALIKELEDNFEVEKQKMLNDLAKEKRGLLKELKNLKSNRRTRDLKLQLSELRTELKNREANIKKKDSLGHIEFVQKNKADRLEHELEVCEREIKGHKLLLIKPDKICTRCKNPLTKEQLEAQKKLAKATIKREQENRGLIQAELKEAQSDYTETLARLEKCKKVDVSEIHFKINKLTKEIDNIKHQKELSNKVKAAIEKTEAMIAKVETSKPKLPEIDLAEQSRIETKLNELKPQLIKTKKRINNYIWCIKDPLSNSGIKAHIFDSMLNLVNRELSKYQQSLGFKVEVLMDMGTAKKDVACVITKKGHLINTADLSGGQEQLVDLAIAFALNEVVTKGKDLNILLLDEALVYVSGKELEDMFAFIKTIAHKKSVYLITHQAEFAMTVKRTIRAELGDNGNTIFS